MFLEASVILFTWREEGGRADPLEADLLVLTSRGGHCSGRYTSYWYGFLFRRVFEKGQGQGQRLLAEVLDLPLISLMEYLPPANEV